MSNTAINETYIIEGIGETLDFSACTAIFTNALKSCSGDTAIELGENLIRFNGNALASIISATTYYGDGSNLTGISTQDTYVTGGTYSNGIAVFTNNTGGTFSVTGFTTPFTGGTVTGSTNFTNGLTANTFSATTYLGLPLDITVTGGTYDKGVAAFVNNTGGTFSVTGFTTPFTGGTVTGSTTFTNALNAISISATTYLGLPRDVRVTGGTYSNGTAVFRNNAGGIFNVTGFYTGTTIPTLQVVTDQPSGNTTTNSIIHTNGSNLKAVLGNDGVVSSLSFFDTNVYPSQEQGIYAGFGFVLNDELGNPASLTAMVQYDQDNIGFSFQRGLSGAELKLSPTHGDLVTDISRIYLPKGYPNDIPISNFGKTIALSYGNIFADDYGRIPSPENIILVAKSGGNFTSIKAAVDSVTGSSEINRYTIKVAPGIYFEDEIDLTNKPYVSVVGEAIQSVVVSPNTPTQNLFKLGFMSEISFMTLQGVGFGYSAILVDDIGDYAQAHKISFNYCDINVSIFSSTQDTKFFGEYLDFNGEYSYGTKVIANNGYLAFANMENYYNYPTGSGITIGNHAQGSGATLSIFVGDGVGNGNVNSTNYQIYDYASLNTLSITADNWGYGVRVLNIGGPSKFDIDSYSVVNSINYDLSIEHPYTFGTFGGGSSTNTKINNLSDSVYWAYLDTNDGEFEITRKISVTFQDNTHTDASTLIFRGSTMGIMEGGVITHVSGLTFQVSAGYGYLEKTVGSEIYMRIDWDDTLITLLPDNNKYLYFNENEILSASSTRPNSVNNIILGRVVTNSNNVIFIEQTPLNADHTSNRFANLFREALGSIYAFGSIVSEGTTPFTLDVSDGEYYYSTNEYKPIGGTGITFTQYYTNGFGGWNTSDTTLVNNTQFDNNGVLSGLTSSAYTKHTLYVVSNDTNEKYMLVLGQKEYSTLVEVEDALLPLPPDYFNDSVTQIASIYIREGLSNILFIEDVRPVIGFKAAGVNASSLHSNLLGLTSDDHKQYLLVNGNRAMSNNLDMGGNAIVSALTVNSVVVESHASRHKNGGADEIATATPAPSEIPKADTFGKLDGWISDSSSSIKGLTKLSVNPVSSSNPIAVGVNDLSFQKAITGVTNIPGILSFSNVSGTTTDFNTLIINTISAATYQNLPLDIRVTGGTFSVTDGTTTFVNNTGGTFSVTGFSTGYTLTVSAITDTLGYIPLSADTFVTGGTYNNNTFTYTNNTGGTFNVLFNTVTGLTVNNSLIATTISATTYQNLPIDIRVTGSTKSGNIATFTNNSGGTFTLTGLTDTFVTGGTYSNGTATFTNNTGGTFSVTGFSTGYTLTSTNISTALGYTPANDSNVVHLTGNETIDGNKTFLGQTLLKNAQPLTIVSPDYSSGSAGALLYFLTPSGQTYSSINSRSNGGGLGGDLILQEFSSNVGIGITTPNYKLQVDGTFGATSVSATTYYGLPLDVFVTGGTYTAGTTTFTNNTGGTFSVTGFTTLFTGGTVTGATSFTNGLTANTFSATTYQNLPIDIFSTGATYSAGTAIFTNNTGGTFSLTGLIGATRKTGTTISFSGLDIYNSSSVPSSATGITQDLTSAKIGVVQKIYHQSASAPSFPAGWVKLGAGSYVNSSLNLIYAEWDISNRVEYWIVQ